MKAPALDLESRLLDAAARSCLLSAYATRDEIRYVVAAPAGAQELVQPLGPGRSARAFSRGIPLLSWDEREIADAWDVAFDALPDPRQFFITRTSTPAAILASGEGLMHFVVGPVHAGIIEPGRFTFSSGGETVVHLDAQLSFSHRGVERLLEAMPAADAAARVARICGSCSAARSFAYARALEARSGVTLADEVELARLVIAELERIYNHLSDLSASASAAGFGPGFARGMAVKEKAMQVNGLAAGHRLLFDAIVPGGVGPGVLRDPAAIARAVETLQRDVERYLRTLFGNASLLSRWHRTGTLERGAAQTFGAVGPALRACRAEVDVRTLVPYGAYRGCRVRVAASASADVFARCSVKRAEIVESLRLIREALAQLPPTFAPARVGLAPASGSAVGLVEGPRGAEVVAVHVDGAGCLERIHVRSASFRNWPIVVASMEGNIVPDFPLVNKSFNLCYACADR